MKISKLPDEFLASCSEEEKIDVVKWWTELEMNRKSELAILLDHRQNSLAYVFDHGDADWKKVPIDSSEVENENDSESFERDRFNQWLEHVLDHPEINGDWDPSEWVVRSFRICKHQHRAREVHQSGLIEADFRCPVHDQLCPIQSFARPIRKAFLIGPGPTRDRTTWLCQLVNT